MNKYVVYIIKCSDESFYTGVTNDFERRIAEHQEGSDPSSYTFNRRPLEIVFLQEFQDIKEAISFEKQIKGWGRAKKEALIKNNWGKLKVLSQCKNATSHLNNENKNEK